VIDSAFGALILVIGKQEFLKGAQQVVSEHPRFGVGSCIDFKSIMVRSVEIVCRSSFRTIRRIVC